MGEPSENLNIRFYIPERSKFEHVSLPTGAVKKWIVRRLRVRTCTKKSRSFRNGVFFPLHNLPHSHAFMQRDQKHVRTCTQLSASQLLSSSPIGNRTLDKIRCTYHFWFYWLSAATSKSFFFYLICTLEFVQLDVWSIFLTLLLNNTWMAIHQVKVFPPFRIFLRSIPPGVICYCKIIRVSK